MSNLVVAHPAVRSASMIIKTSGAAYFPAENTRSLRLLRALLTGTMIDAGHAYAELNISTLQARASELRKLGWPVRALEKPHPKFINEKTTYYLLDSAFRQWLANNPNANPKAYEGQSGRGKYAADRGPS